VVIRVFNSEFLFGGKVPLEQEFGGK